MTHKAKTRIISSILAMFVILGGAVALNQTAAAPFVNTIDGNVWAIQNFRYNRAPGALVQAVAGGRVVATAYTDNSGYYVMGVPNGNYKVRASWRGLQGDSGGSGCSFPSTWQGPCRINLNVR